MRSPRYALLAALFVPLLVVDGCVDGATSSPKADAAELFAEDTTMVVAMSGGGGVEYEADGSTCRRTDTTFSLTMASRELSWKSCLPFGEAGYEPRLWNFVEGTKVLSDAEYASVVAALQGLSRSSRTECGADKPTMRVVITTPRGTATYIDDFYGCLKSGVSVTNIDPVFQKLDGLTGASSF